MRQVDWVGAPQSKPFKDLPNMRASVAVRKAELMLKLGALINKAPPHHSIDTIQKTRAYQKSRKVSAKVAGSSRSSVQEIESAIHRMEPYFRAPTA